MNIMIHSLHVQVTSYFENLDFELLKDCMKLNNYLKERLCTDKMTYIFLDKVHKLPLFEIV